MGILRLSFLTFTDDTSYCKQQSLNLTRIHFEPQTYLLTSLYSLHPQFIVDSPSLPPHLTAILTLSTTIAMSQPVPRFRIVGDQSAFNPPSDNLAAPAGFIPPLIRRAARRQPRRERRLVKTPRPLGLTQGSSSADLDRPAPLVSLNRAQFFPRGRSTPLDPPDGTEPCPLTATAPLGLMVWAQPPSPSLDAMARARLYPLSQSIPPSPAAGGPDDHQAAQPPPPPATTILTSSAVAFGPDPPPPPPAQHQNLFLVELDPLFGLSVVDAAGFDCFALVWQPLDDGDDGDDSRGLATTPLPAMDQPQAITAAPAPAPAPTPPPCGCCSQN